MARQRGERGPIAALGFQSHTCRVRGSMERLIGRAVIGSARHADRDGDEGWYALVRFWEQMAAHRGAQPLRYVTCRRCRRPKERHELIPTRVSDELPLAKICAR